MAGLSIPDDFPLSSLVGQEVTQVRVGIGQVQLHFYRPIANSNPRRWEPGARIETEAGYALVLPGCEPQIVGNDLLAKQAGQLTCLLGNTVESVAKKERNELLIEFTSNVLLRLLTDPTGFESYHLHIDGDSIDVTKPW